MLTEKILQNIRKIMNDRKLTQSAIAEMMETSESQFSKILKGQVQLSIKQLENLASGLSMSEIDIISYPARMVEAGASDGEPVEAVLQIKLKKDKKDQVLRLVFGDNNIEILNK